MKMKPRLLCALVSGAALFACDDSKPVKKLVIDAKGPLTLTVGDTSDVIHGRKTTVDNAGRETTADYNFFRLISGDTNVVSEYLGRLIARNPGETTVKALDDNEPLYSENKLTVTVVAKP